MKLVNKIFLSKEQSHVPFNLRKVCRIIRDNMKYDSSIAVLGEELGLQPNSGKVEIKAAMDALVKRLPYYSLEDTEYHSGIIPVRLVQIGEDKSFKVVPETNIIHFLNTVINDRVYKAMILPVNKFMRFTGRDAYELSMCEFTRDYSSKNKYLTEEEYWSMNLRIQFLMDRQLPNIPIYPFMEISGNQCATKQIAYLFTISERNDVRRIIMETSSINTASYLFEVKKSYYEDTIDQIKEYFGSTLYDKRLGFIDADLVFSQDKGFICRRKIIHTNLVNWMKDIELINIGIK